MSTADHLSIEERLDRFNLCPCEIEAVDNTAVTTEARPYALDERRVITLAELGSDLAAPRRHPLYRRPAWVPSEQPVAFISHRLDTQELALLEGSNEFLSFTEQIADPAACGRLVLFTSDGDEDVEVYAMPFSRELVAVDRR